jgi:hypothetical protein
MAEDHLLTGNISAEKWPGRRFRFSENLENGMWASVVTEIERRDDEWIVTRLDRSREKVDATGFEELA